MSTIHAEPETLFERRGPAAIITLNRPRQLNALTHGMVQAIMPRMLEWRDDPAVTRIIIRGAGEKAFCAGGDIRALYDLGKAGRVAEARPFWREEYILNHLLKTFPKPIIALLDGIVMGGGVGMSFHGSHRVASEKLMFAMPEVGIGFFPDVGASHFLPRLPHRIGSYLALTGARIGLGDALALGLVTNGVESARMGDVLEALCEPSDVDQTLASFAVSAPPAPLIEHGPMIAEIFSEADLATVFAKVSQMAFGGALFATQTLETMETKSPTSMAIALEQMQRGAAMTFAEAMQMEYRIVCRIAEGHDFYEGVRAVIVDKDHAPKWKPARVEMLDAASIASHFAPLHDDLLPSDLELV
ncbi:MAG: enoyl-CoA hydratase/isomerase family protein [Beijerinckiaceae bacterium]